MLKKITCQISISILFIASLLFSSLSTAPLRADVGELDKRTFFKFDAGLIPTGNSRLHFKSAEGTFRSCSYLALPPLVKLISECLEDPNLELIFSNSLGPCNTDLSIPCIEDVFARNPNTEWLRGNFSRYLDNYRVFGFGAMPEYQIGEQHDNNLYTFPGLTNDPNQLFAIQPLLKTGVVRQVVAEGGSLNINLHAVKKLSDGVGWVGLVKNRNNPIGYSSSEEYENDLTCTFLQDHKEGCWDYVGNPLSNQFKIVLRLSSVPEGWLTGRLFSPDVDFTVVPGVAQPYRVTIVGSPIPTPAISKIYFSDDLEDKAACTLFDQARKTFNGRSFGCFDVNRSDSIPSFDIDRYQYLKNQMPELDIATKILDQWQVNIFLKNKNLPQNQVGCRSDQFRGFVSSNALTYEMYPNFDAALQSLNYVVGGPHFMPDKSVFSGLYSVIITKDYAKCLWGLSSPVFNASVQVVDQDGVVSTAVTTIGVDDQFVRFSASGFTFSKKIMRVKVFETEKEVDRSKKKVITCVKKQKVIRFVDVASCPKGFKIKK